MAFDTTDIIDQEAVRSQVYEITQENLVFRQAFRRINASNYSNDTIKVPIPNDELGEPDTIAEGGEYPYDEEGYDTVSISREKVGQMIPITDEAEMDSLFDVVRDMTERQGRKMAEGLDHKAFLELDNNLAGTVGDDQGTLAWAEIVEGRRSLMNTGYNADLLILDSYAWEDLMNDSEFNRATNVGDQMATSGNLPQVAGLNPVVSNSGDMAQHDAYLVDTSYYGYEATWSAVETDMIRDDFHDTDFIKIRSFKGWEAIDSDAAYKVQG
jgi:hypothetical protein